MEKKKKKKKDQKPAGTEIAKRDLNWLNGRTVIFKQRVEHGSRHSGKKIEAPRSFTSLLGSRLHSVISTLAGLLGARCNFSTNCIPVAFRKEAKNHSSVQEILEIYQLEI